MCCELIWATGPPDGQKSENFRADPQETDLRAGFLREQWEVHGPGQLALVTSWLDAGPYQPVTIHLEMPNGSPSASSIDGESCRCDALLHDIESALPETQRLTWVIVRSLLRQLENGNKTVAGFFPDKPAGVDSTTVAAALTIRSGIEMGVLAGDHRELIERANMLWGFQAGSADVEWAVEFLSAGSIPGFVERQNPKTR